VGAQVIERLGGSLSALRQRVLEEARAAPGPATRGEGDPESLPRDWPPALAVAQEAFVHRERAAGLRNVLTPIDRRLAEIERRLGIAAEEEPAAGFRGLLALVEQRLANIERHVGIGADKADAEPGEQGPAAAEE
jgi:hypothetical protein